MVDMIVSNGTLCDEFYEILDALYINPAVVEDIEVIKSKRRTKDVVRNSNYSDTAFAHAVRKFSIDILHEGPASLFEIPLAYYASLPNSQRFVAEITALVEAVVKTLSDELYMWERPDDAKLSSNTVVFLGSVTYCSDIEVVFDLVIIHHHLL
ncbi:MAG: hypothetical protein V8S77_01225 [Oscillospiraceae bacterium]